MAVPCETTGVYEVSDIAQFLFSKDDTLLEVCLRVFKRSGAGCAMSDISKHRILVVDDELAVRDVMASLLNEGGYDVTTAQHGFDALAQLRTAIPDVIISDLNMPQMSGFEFLSVVRRRFPEVVVVAISGAYQSGDEVPGGVIADAFFAKGRLQFQELLPTVAALIDTKSARAISHRRESAPVWIPRNGKDAKGIPFIVLNCTECLRSFPLSVLNEDLQEIQQTACAFCATPVRYIIDFSLAVTSPKARAATPHGQLPAAGTP